MPSIPLHASLTARNTPENPLPALLHTPTGLALLELQGTIHFPPPAPSTATTLVGKLVFPLYNPEINGAEDTKWMKRVYFYIGENQRMTGEVKRLGKPIAVVRKRAVRHGEEISGVEEEMEGVEGGETQEELEIVEIVRWKVVFSSRPEPVSDVVVEKEEV
jgi:chromosome transmission fidelity protein 8